MRSFLAIRLYVLILAVTLLVSSCGSGGRNNSQTPPISVTTNASKLLPSPTALVTLSSPTPEVVPTPKQQLMQPSPTAISEPTPIEQVNSRYIVDVRKVNRIIGRGKVRYFFSRPDIKPPTVTVRTSSKSIADGYIFIAPKKGPGQSGPMIVDNQGEVVWFLPMRAGKRVLDFKVQNYKGNPVLTWWEGALDMKLGSGKGDFVIMNMHYKEIARVKAGNGYYGDLHEFLITPEGTALFLIYHPVTKDLSDLGGVKNTHVIDGIVQEVDIESGRVLFEWHSLDHVGLDESYIPVPKNSGQRYDYFHANSIALDKDGNLLVSARHTWAAYKIDRDTGNIIWRLGGKKSDFTFESKAKFAYQHDVRRQPDGTITLFDNVADSRKNGKSRGLVLRVDEQSKRVELVKEYIHPDRILSMTQGNMQILSNGHVFIGWGSEPFFSEFDQEGNLLFDAQLPTSYDNYRSYRFEWSGEPESAPRIVAQRNRSQDKVTIYVSWNGATSVHNWEVLAGNTPGSLMSLGVSPKMGFETAILLKTNKQYFAVRALDENGNVIGKSSVVKITNMGRD